MTYPKNKLYIIWIKELLSFPRVNNKKIMKRGAHSIFFEVSIVAITGIIAILLTPGIFSPHLNYIGPIAIKLAYCFIFYTPPP